MFSSDWSLFGGHQFIPEEHNLLYFKTLICGYPGQKQFQISNCSELDAVNNIIATKNGDGSAVSYEKKMIASPNYHLDGHM